MSSSNFLERHHPLPEEMPNKVVNGFPGTKVTARKSTRFLRTRAPYPPVANIKTEPLNPGDISPGRMESPFLYSALSMPSGVISPKNNTANQLNIPAHGAVAEPPKPSAFNTSQNHSLRGSAVPEPLDSNSRSLIPSAAPAPRPQTARKSFPGSSCSSLLRCANESPTLRYLLLRSLNNPLLRDWSLTCSKVQHGKGAFLPEQRYVEASTLQRSHRKASTDSLKRSLRSLPSNREDRQSGPMVIVDGSIRRVLGKDGFPDSTAIIYLNEEESLVFDKPDRFTLVPSSADCCRPERFDAISVPEEADKESVASPLPEEIEVIDIVSDEGEAPEEINTASVEDEVPEKANNESVADEVSEVIANANVVCEVPEKIDNASEVLDEVPEKIDNESLVVEVPEKTDTVSAVDDVPEVIDIVSVVDELPQKIDNASVVDEVAEEAASASIFAELPELPPVLEEEVWPEPPGLFLEAAAEEDRDDATDMPQLLEPDEENEEPDDREASRSPEMPVLLPVDLFGDGAAKGFFGAGQRPVHAALFRCLNGHFQRRPRRRGVSLGFQRQCLQRTMKTEAYFQGRYAFMAGKKVRDPNYVRGMGSIRKAGSGRGRGRPPLLGRRPRVARGRGRPRVHPEGVSRTAMQRNPHVDVVDGVEFLSFETERDLKRFMRTHPSYTLDVSRMRTADAELAKMPLPQAIFMSSALQKLRVRGQPIVLTKTKDITKIKGWRHKVFYGCPGSEDEHVAADGLSKQLVERRVSRTASETGSDHEAGVTDTVEEEEAEDRMEKVVEVPDAGDSDIAKPLPGQEPAKKPTDTKSAFVSDFLDEFLRKNSQLRIGTAATLGKEAGSKSASEIDTKVVWPTKDDYPLPPAFEDNYPFVLAPPARGRRAPGRPPKSGSARVKEADRVKRKYTKRTPPMASPKASPRFSPVARPRISQMACPGSSPMVSPRISQRVITAVNTETKTVTMETPGYLKTRRPAASAQTAPTSKVSIEPVTMSLSDANFAAMALVSHSWQKTADTLPPLEEIGRMCRRAREPDEVVRQRERMCRQFSVVMDRKHVERALRALATCSEADTQVRPASPDILSKEFHNLSAEEKWEKMMDCSVEGDPFSVLEDLEQNPEPRRTLSEPRKSQAVTGQGPRAEPAASGSRCGEPFCQLGCVCSSLKTSRKRRKHCGRAQCMLACRCRETDALQARSEEDASPPKEEALPAKRRSREIRLPARLKDSVCMWNQSWAGKDSPLDEDFCLGSTPKKRGKYNTKKQRALKEKELRLQQQQQKSSRMTLWTKPPTTAGAQLWSKKPGIDDERPSAQSQNARKQFMARRLADNAAAPESTSGSARKGFIPYTPRPTMSVTARKGVYYGPKLIPSGPLDHGGSSLLKQSSESSLLPKKSSEGPVLPKKSSAGPLLPKQSSRSSLLSKQRSERSLLPKPSSGGPVPPKQIPGSSLLQKQSSVGPPRHKRTADHRPRNSPRTGPDDSQDPTEDQSPSAVLHPGRRALIGPDGTTIVGFLAPAAGGPTPASGPEPQPPPRKTARKSVSAPLNQRKMLEQMNMIKQAQLDAKSSTEDIVTDVVTGIVTKVTLNAELEAALRGHRRDDKDKPTRARMGWRRPDTKPAQQDASKPPAQQDASKPAVEASPRHRDDKDARRRKRRGEIESCRRVMLRKGFQRLSGMLEPEGKVCDNDKMRDIRIRYYITKMATIATKQLQCDQKQLVDAKRNLIKRRMDLFARCAQLLKGMSTQEQNDVVEDLADGMQTLSRRRAMTGPLTLESLCRSTMPTDLSFTTVGREAMDREFFKGWLNEEHFASDVDDSDLWSSGDETIDGREDTVRLDTDSNKNYLKQGPQPSAAPAELPKQQNPKASAAKTAKPTWTPLHGSAQPEDNGKAKFVRIAPARHSLQQAGPVRTFRVCTQPGGPGPSWPMTSFMKPVLGPFEKPRILQRAKVTDKDPAPSPEPASGNLKDAKPTARSRSDFQAALAYTRDKQASLKSPADIAALPKLAVKPSTTSSVVATTTSFKVTAASFVSSSPKTVATLVPLSNLLPVSQKKPGDSANLEVYDSHARTFKTVTVSDSILKQCSVVPKAVAGKVGSNPSLMVSGASIPATKFIISPPAGVAVPPSVGNVAAAGQPRPSVAAGGPPLIAPRPHQAAAPNRTYTTTDANGNSFPLFCTFPTSGQMTIPVTVAALAKPGQKGPNTTLVIGIIPASTSTTTTTSSSAACKVTGSADKITPIMTISVPASTKSITLDGKKLRILNTSSRFGPRLVGATASFTALPAAAAAAALPITPVSASASATAASSAAMAPAVVTMASSVTTPSVTVTATHPTAVAVASSALRPLMLEKFKCVASVRRQSATNQPQVQKEVPEGSGQKEGGGNVERDSPKPATAAQAEKDTPKTAVVSTATPTIAARTMDGVSSVATVSCTATQTTCSVPKVAVTAATSAAVTRTTGDVADMTASSAAAARTTGDVANMTAASAAVARTTGSVSRMTASSAAAARTAVEVASAAAAPTTATQTTADVTKTAAAAVEKTKWREMPYCHANPFGRVGQAAVKDRAQNPDLERVAANPELQVIEIRKQAADVAWLMAAAAGRPEPPGAPHEETGKKNEEPNHGSSSGEEVESSGGSSSPDVVVIEATEARGQSEEAIASFVDHHEKLLASLKELTVVRLPPKTQTPAPVMPANTPAGGAEDKAEEWPKIVAFTSISEDEFLCEVPGKVDDGVLVLDGVVENPLDVQTLIT